MLVQHSLNEALMFKNHIRLKYSLRGVFLHNGISREMQVELELLPMRNCIVINSSMVKRWECFL